MADAKQRLFGLKVKEISLVDSPAIVEEFIVTKRVEIQKAEGAATDPDPVVPVAKAEGDAAAPVVPAGEGDAMPLTQALIAEKIGAVQAGLVKLVADLASGSADVDACRERMWAIQDLCWDICRDSSALSVAKSMDGPANIGKVLATIQKSREGMKVEKADPGTADVAADTNAVAAESAVKPAGAKKFTKARVTKLVGALASLQEVLQEVAPGDVEKALSAVVEPGGDDATAGGSTNSVPSAGSAAQDLTKRNDEVEVLKAEVAEGKAAVASAQATATELEKRLAKLEAVGVSKSLPTDAGADTSTAAAKSTWAGFLDVPVPT